MKTHNLVLFSLFIFFGAKAQVWVEKAQKTNANFYEIQAEFEAYWKGRDITEKGKGYKTFKRWENFVERRVYPSGDLSLLNLTAKNYQKFLLDYNAQNPVVGGGKGFGQNQIASATFTAMGPFGALNGTAGGQLLKSGRINFITIDPTNSNNLWIGAPAGGLWRSTNGGTSWTTNTDFLSVIGCSDLVIDPNNTSIMYLATGDGDAGDTRSIGVLKSTDGGLTWNPTGLTFPVANNYLIRKMIINPANTQIIIAATNGGIYRTTNAGTSWTQVSATSAYDLEFKPGNPSVVYAAGNTFRLSTDGGVTWTVISNGIPNTGINRMAIAVTPNDANYVYVLASDNSNSGFYGFYRSITSGTAFTVMTNTPNLLGWANNGSDTGGQGWYDLCVAASPLNKDEVIVGGVNVWRTVNGGSAWTIYGHWTGSGAPFTHADQHDLEYDAAGNLFDTNDGTVYKRVGANWVEISGTINISQIYKMGISAITPNKWISGHQDNGTSVWNGTTYNAAIGGDGMDCFIDRTNDLNMFGETQNGGMRKSTNGGTSWSSCVTGLTGTAPWVTVWKQDPQSATTLYAGWTDLFKSTNLAASWTTLTPIPAAGTIREFAIAPSNNQIIYVLKSAGIYKTTNGGTSWVNVTGTVPVGSANPEFICIDPTDPNNAWVVLSGYSSGNKVFVTTNGGTSWTNFTANLPNIPGNCLIYQPGTNDRIYVGMDVGIYYRDNLAANWTLYNQGLPNVPIADFEISPATPSLLHVATFGRGVWVASLFTNAPSPVSLFTVTAGAKCEATSIPFSDQSSNSPTSWSWSVVPAAGVAINTPTAQNPLITFPNGGSYTVSVVASNSVGPGTTYTQVVTITSLPTLTIPNANQSICIGAGVSFTASGATTYTWSNSGGNLAVANFTPATNTTYTVSGTQGGCASSTVCSVVVNTPPVLGVSGPNSFCPGTPVSFTASGATTYTWSHSGGNQAAATFTPLSNTTYTVFGGNNGCNSSTVWAVTLSTPPSISISGPNSICQGAVLNLTASGVTSYTWSHSGGNLASASFTPVNGTTYSVTGNLSGCTSTTVFAVTVNPSPTLSVSGQNNGCKGAAFTFTASGATSYTWSPTGGNQAVASVTPQTNTAYSVTGILGGCPSTTVWNVMVTPAPTISINGPTSICKGASAVLLASGASSYTWSTMATTPLVTLSPSVSTAYTVSGGYSSGCLSSTAFTITVNNLPAVCISGPTAVCSGNSAVLSGCGAFTYTWSNGQVANAITVNPTVATQYSVTGMDLNGCVNTAQTLLNVNPLPTVVLSNFHLQVCDGEQISVLASGASSYVWQPGGIQANPFQMTVNNSATYTCIGTDNNNCSAGSVLIIDAAECVSIRNSAGSVTEEIKVYPNPNNGYLYLESVSHRIENIDIEVYDALGKSLFSKTVAFNGSGVAQIDLHVYADGVYFLDIKNQSGKDSRVRILKQD